MLGIFNATKVVQYLSKIKWTKIHKSTVAIFQTRQKAIIIDSGGISTIFSA